jgi:hypothetical protein
MAFLTVCAFRRTPDGLLFMPATGTRDDHPLWCEMRASIAVEAEAVAPVISAVEIRCWGTGFATDVQDREGLQDEHWRHLDAEAFEAACGFLLLNYRHELTGAAEEAALCFAEVA